MAKKISIPNDLQISAYAHCSLCLAERPRNKTPQEWARVQAGFTSIGLQVWCVRHDCNIMHIDFEGQRHPANTTRPQEVSK
jgi:hypothetical protein